MLVLAQDCAPAVAPETLLSVAKVESRFDPLAIGVNGRSPRSIRPSSKSDTVRQAADLIASGASVDLGLAQINSRNLEWLGLTLEDAFDPCRNLEAASKVLVANYKTAAADQPPQAALRRALSMYNTGSKTRGFHNGYVGKVAKAADYVVPALQASGTSPNSAGHELMDATAHAPETPSWDVFGHRRASPAMVFSSPARASSAPGHQRP
ncbi:lytic transglycosylase domain-containing protein [Phenylobacterium sp. LjRoot219]|uniref:lytic transglycosylase domain-containing protein n=1 Tax=Phenylobacterium sp. LjRoot219 TaxID=3342283 RepID=UPI003F4FCFAF